MSYSYKKSIVKALLQILVFAIPILLDILPGDVLNLTLGGALSALFNYSKHNISVKFLNL